MYSIANCYSNLTKEDKSHFTVAEPEGQIAKVGGWVLTLQTVVGFPPIGLVKQSLDVQFVCMCVHACTCARVSEFPDTMCVHVPTRVGRGCRSLELESDMVVRFCGGGWGGEGAGSQTWVLYKNSQYP